MVYRPAGRAGASSVAASRATHARDAAAAFGSSAPIAAASLLLSAAALVLLAGTLALASDTRYAFDPPAAVGAVASQLPATAVPALLVALAAIANVVAGAILLRLATRVPYRSLGDAVLGGFAAAVVLDAANLFLLGSLGLFNAPVLVLIHVAIFVAGWWARPLAVGVRLRPPADVPLAWWPLVLLVWAAPLALQLASPAVPFMDVLPNHVAPVEHLRAYGSFDALTIMPSPIYGPSRQFIGYVGLLGTMSVLTTLPAVLAVAAFALPETIVCAAAVHRLAASLLGRRAGYWALLTFPLTYDFLRLPDARATVVVLPIAAWVLVQLSHEIDRPSAEAGTAEFSSAPASAAVRLGVGFAAAILIHPLVGAACVITAVVAAMLRPERLGPLVVAAGAGAAPLVLVQLATMLATPLPSWAGLGALTLGALLLVAASRVRWPRDLLRAAPRIVFATIAILAVVFARGVIPPLADAVSKLVTSFPLLSLVAIGGAALTLRRNRAGWTVLAAAVAVGLAGEAATQLVPEGSLLEASVKFEIPKTIGYWTPVLLAIAAAAGLAGLTRPGPAAAVRLGALAAILGVATLPILQGSETRFDIVERAYAVSAADNLSEAEQGYWAGYRDPRLIIDADGQGVVDFLRAEQRAGRLGRADVVLHIASSFQQWVSIPVGVFTGALETTATLDPEHSIHTTGGRLFGLSDIPALLNQARYVVYEPANLPADFVPAIEGAGFTLVYSNASASVYARR